MQHLTELNSETFVLYAYRNYRNPQCVGGIAEFESDLQAFKYVKKLINKYLTTDQLSYRLIMNHVILIYNVFGIEAANKMMEFKMGHKHWTVLKPILLYLDYIGPTDYINVTQDQAVIEELRSI